MGTEVGKKYKVTGNDCCIQASFTATVTEITYFTEDKSVVDAVKFDNGVTIEGTNWKLEGVA